MRRGRPDAPDGVSRFEREAGSRGQGVVGELWGFLRANKKWWLTPVVVTLLLVAALAVLAGSAGAPLLYTLF